MYLNKELDYLKISIHTPAKGVTQGLNIPICQTSHYFNPHSREGSDGLFLCLFLKLNPISIHTPVKGVTVVNPTGEIEYRDFNPHSREGSDYFKRF